MVSIDLDVDDQGHPTETVTLAYGKIDIEYKPQQGNVWAGRWRDLLLRRRHGRSSYDGAQAVTTSP